MPKKFAGENSKAVVAKARKAAAKDVETAKKQKEVEESYWRDDDKQIVRKQQKKEEQERKKQLALEKKAEAKEQIEKELESLKKSTTKNVPPPKITRAQIESTRIVVEKKVKEKPKVVEIIPLEENINRIVVDGEEARSVTEAISILSVTSEAEDRHPEKRLKAAYAAYEEKRLAELKVEHPSLRLSQLKQMIFKEWQKSPENPLNKNN